MLHSCISKILIAVITVILVVSVLVIWQPLKAKRSVDLEYVRAKLRAIAEIVRRTDSPDSIMLPLLNAVSLHSLLNHIRVAGIIS